METAVPALPPVGAGEGDVLPGIRPGHLVTFVLHILNKTLPINGVLQRLVDGLNQIQLPELTSGLIQLGRAVERSDDLPPLPTPPTWTDSKQRRRDVLPSCHSPLLQGYA